MADWLTEVERSGRPQSLVVHELSEGLHRSGSGKACLVAAVSRRLTVAPVVLAREVPDAVGTVEGSKSVPATEPG